MSNGDKKMSAEELEIIKQWEAYHKAISKYIKELKDYYKSDLTIRSGNPPSPPPPPPGPR